MTYINIFSEQDNNQESIFIKCSECKQSLKVCRIQRKRINRNMDFVVLSYYCRHCDLTYLIFKTIQKNIIRRF